MNQGSGVSQHEQGQSASEACVVRDAWDPRVVAPHDGNVVMGCDDAFPFHRHDDSDDFLPVVEGEVVMDLEGRDSVTLGPGERVVVPAGIAHRLRATGEAHVLLIEPAGLP